MRPQDAPELETRPAVAAVETPSAFAGVATAPGFAAVETPPGVATAVETQATRPATPIVPLVDIVVPVYNEEADLESSVRRLRAYLDDRFPFTSAITIADNASTDSTWAIASRLAGSVPGVRALHLDQKGRGRALRQAWLGSEALIVAYTDVDLSTDLDALLPVVAPLMSGHSEVAIGSRLAHGARVTRGPKRELISRSYNLILRTVLRVGFRDAQCGFKAIRADVARLLLPEVQDQAWFFDTELLVLAERAGLRVHEVPVDWVDDPDSRVAIASTALADLRGIWRLLGSRSRLRLAASNPGRRTMP
jgi:glycosyltransferase involved in cell wall biosynthesis